MSKFFDGPDFTLTIEYERGDVCWYWVALDAPGLHHPDARHILPAIARAGGQVLEGKQLYTEDAVEAECELLRLQLHRLQAGMRAIAAALDDGAGECETANTLAAKVAADIREVLDRGK